MKILFRIIIFSCCLLAAEILTNGAFDLGKPFMNQAEARVGRPLTPGSVAGVARRTTRRRIHRTSVIIATLPQGCSTVIIEGISLHQCGGSYYQPQGTQFVVVNVN
ncbi:MAG: hypothetical protein QNK27_13440 [Desulfuromusa sp.]|nr:hypothetical protein [Desulfuromusa sp.]